MLIHPELKKIHEQFLEKKTINIQSYYLKKYEYLKKHGFFSKFEFTNFASLDESTVKDTIIQTRQLVFEVTDFCNLNCSYCAYGDLYEGFEKRNFKNIETSHAINLLKYIVNIKPKNKNNKLYIGFYGGEPILNIKFIKKIVNIANQLKSKKDIDFGYSMTTNATLAQNHIDFFVENKFRLLISLDGNKENHSYRIFRKSKDNSFSLVIENLDLIQNKYPEYFSEYVSFNAVLHNKNSVKDIYEFIYNRYNKIPKISELSLDNIKPQKEKILNTIFHSKRKSESEYLAKESEITQITHSESLHYDESTNFLKYNSINYYISNITSLLHNTEKIYPTDTCLPFSRKIFLNTHNQLLPCEKINFKYSIGKVDKDIIIDIPKITHQYNRYYNNLKRTCQHCYSFRFCGLCMFQIKNLEKLDTDEFICDRFYDQDSFKKKLYRIFSFLEKYPNDFFQILENVLIA